MTDQGKIRRVPKTGDLLQLVSNTLHAQNYPVYAPGTRLTTGDFLMVVNRYSLTPTATTHSSMISLYHVGDCKRFEAPMSHVKHWLNNGMAEIIAGAE